MDHAKWSWKDAIEIVGVLGAIGSLIFVAFQIQQLIAYYRALLRLQLNRFFQVELGILDEETALALGGRATPYRRPIFAVLSEETKADYSPEFQEFVRRGILPMVEETC
jgi:hypothetical protein